MTHEEAIELVHARYDAALPEAARAELDAHLAECERCRGVEATYGLLYEALDEERSHPAVDEIVSYATSPDASAAPDRSVLEEHLAGCSRCRDEVERVRRVDASLRHDPRGGNGAGGRFRRISLRGSTLAWAAAVAAAVLAYPAYLGLVRLPEVAERAALVAEERSDLASEVARLQRWSGVTDLQVVGGALRGAGGAPEIVARAGRPFVVLGIQMVVPSGVPDEAELQCRLIDASGSTRAEIRLEAREARERIRSPGVITWLLSSARLDEGMYTLRIEGPESLVIFEVPVRVRVVP